MTTTTTPAEPNDETVQVALARLEPGEIHTALKHVMDDVGAVGKEQRNQQQGYAFRGIDDLMNAVHPALAKYGVTITPTTRKRIVERNGTRNGGVMTNVSLLVDYTFRAEDGSSIVARVWGEGADVADKATSKALSMALKYALLQTLMIPTRDMQDADRDTLPAEQGAVPPVERRPVPPAEVVPDIHVILDRLDNCAKILGKTRASLTEKWRKSNNLGPVANLPTVEPKMLYDFVVALTPFVDEAIKQQDAEKADNDPPAAEASTVTETPADEGKLGGDGW